MKKIKPWQIILIIIAVFLFYNLIDLGQAVIFNNTPLISYKTEDTNKNGKIKYGLFFNTYVYCNNEKMVMYSSKGHLRSYNYKGCEKDEGANELVKSYLTSLSEKEDYTATDDYAFVTETLTGSVIAIEDLYEIGNLTNEEAEVAISVIEKISDCKIEEEYGKKWSDYNEFFSLWKDSKCREKYLDKYTIK